MRKLSLIHRIEQAVIFFRNNPDMEQAVRYLSNNLDPKGENAGVCSYIVQKDGVITYAEDFGFEKDLDRNIVIRIEDDNPLSIAARTQDIQIVNMQTLYEEYKDSTHKELQSHYLTGMAISLDSHVVIGILLRNAYVSTVHQRGYFKCINEILKSWYAHQAEGKESNSLVLDPISRALSERQCKIVELIKENRTNASIAEIIGYSESLIRQETIIIYRKLGVEGRKNLLNKSNFEEHSQ